MNDKIDYSALNVRYLAGTLDYFGNKPSSIVSEHQIPDLEGLSFAACEAAYELGKSNSLVPRGVEKIVWGEYVLKIDVASAGKMIRVNVFLEDEAADINALEAWMFREGYYGEWDTYHRLVDEDYRGNGLGRMALNIQDSFIRGISDKAGKAQQIFIDVEQVDVLGLYLADGFEPASDNDREILNRVLTNDGVFCATTQAGKIIVDEIFEEEAGLYSVGSNPRLRDYVLFDGVDFRQIQIRLKKTVGKDRNLRVEGIGGEFRRAALKVVF